MPFFSTTRPILMRPNTGGVIAKPVVMRALVKKGHGAPVTPAWPWGWSCLDKESPTSWPGEWIALQKLRLVLEQFFRIQPDGIFTSFPANTAAWEGGL